MSDQTEFGLTPRELLDLYDRTAMYPRLRAEIRRILLPDEADSSTIDAKMPPEPQSEHETEDLVPHTGFGTR